MKNCFNEWYKFIITEKVPTYLCKDWNGTNDQKTIARFRCGTVCIGSKVWKEDDERQCRLCGAARETVLHWIMECRELSVENEEKGNILADSGEGLKWMKVILCKLKKKSETIM